jgi:Flp pilus assembly protein TadD
LNRASEALPELETAVSLDPDSPSIRNDYAVALFLTGSTDRAVEEMRRSATLSPDDPLVRIRLGQMLTQLGREAEAQAAFDEARAIDPSIFEESP